LEKTLVRTPVKEAKTKRSLVYVPSPPANSLCMQHMHARCGLTKGNARCWMPGTYRCCKAISRTNDGLSHDMTGVVPQADAASCSAVKALLTNSESNIVSRLLRLLLLERTETKQKCTDVYACA